MINAILPNLTWINDYRGDEVGYSGVLLVGLYESKELDCDFYINMDNLEVLEILPR